MSFKLTVDTSGDTPIFQQIVNGVETAILKGELPVEGFLPSVRELAVTLSVNPNTIAKAYQLLQAQGLVESVRGLGLRVLPQRAKTVERRKTELVDAAIDQLVAVSRDIGLLDEDLVKQLQLRLKGRSFRKAGSL